MSRKENLSASCLLTFKELHVWYVGPHGEPCTRLSDEKGKPKPGCFKYTDSLTGEVIETESWQAEAQSKFQESRWQNPNYKELMLGGSR
jgi:hypothetical protein